METNIPDININNVLIAEILEILNILNINFV